MNYKIGSWEKIKEDERGAVFKVCGTNADMVFLQTKKGFIRGKHYHLGKTKTKNPELLFILKGEFELKLKDINSGEEKTEVLKENQFLEISPNIYHELKALKDGMILEFGFGENVDKDKVKTNL